MVDRNLLLVRRVSKNCLVKAHHDLYCHTINTKTHADIGLATIFTKFPLNLKERDVCTFEPNWSYTASFCICKILLCVSFPAVVLINLKNKYSICSNSLNFLSFGLLVKCSLVHIFTESNYRACYADNT